MNRKCGGCTLCCKLLPVRELDKGANTHCKHQRSGKGCAVYRKPGMPISCSLWSCRWLFDEAASGLSRPDRTHYVIDAMPDYITAGNDLDSARHTVLALQIWIDPKYPDAHRDPALRAYIEKLCEQAPVVGLVRYGSAAGLVLIPPHMNEDGVWMEKASVRTDEEHTPLDLAKVGIGFSVEFQR